MPNSPRLTNLFIDFQAKILCIMFFVHGNRMKEHKLFLQGNGDEICTEFRYKLALKMTV